MESQINILSITVNCKIYYIQICTVLEKKCTMYNLNWKINKLLHHYTKNCKQWLDNAMVLYIKFRECNKFKAGNVQVLYKCSSFRKKGHFEIQLLRQANLT